MSLYIVRIPGYRLTVRASSSFDAIEQVQRQFIARRISAKVAATSNRNNHAGA